MVGLPGLVGTRSQVLFLYNILSNNKEKTFFCLFFDSFLALFWLSLANFGQLLTLFRQFLTISDRVCTDQARSLVHFARVLWLFLFELFFTPPPRKKELGGGVTFGLKRFLNFTNFERFLDTTSDKKTWRWCRKNMEVVSNPEILEILTYFSIFSSPNVTIPDHFWWVLTLFWQILTIFENFWCLLTFFWHFMATFAASWHFSDDFWHFLTLFDTLFDDSWHFLTLFDNSWQFSNLGITSCKLLGIIGLRITRYHFLRYIRYHSNANY